MLLRQVPLGSTRNFGYVIVDEVSRHAAVIDPSFSAAPLEAVLDELSAHLVLVLLTHGHRDHSADAAGLARRRGAKLAAHAASEVPHDVDLRDGDVLTLGDLSVHVLHTPGHTPDSCCFRVGAALFTGDTLFVGECGRVDLAGGDVSAMHHSLLSVLGALPPELEVWPGHDYGPTPTSTLGRERETNYTLAPRSLDEFRAFMREP